MRTKPVPQTADDFKGRLPGAVDPTIILFGTPLSTATGRSCCHRAGHRPRDAAMTRCQRIYDPARLPPVPMHVVGGRRT